LVFGVLNENYDAKGLFKSSSSISYKLTKVLGAGGFFFGGVFNLTFFVSENPS